jgi:peptide deformylase
MNLAKSDRGWISGVAGEGILTIGDPRLKAETRMVDDVGDAADLLVRLVTRLRALNGAGLAAPQVGAAVKVIVVEVRRTDVFPDRPASPLLQMINPRIVESSDTAEIGWEGCFSVPGLMGLVSRPAAITVEYIAPDGARVNERYSGYLARVVQHEIDHLDGIEFLDLMPSLESLTTVANYLTYHRS